MRCPKCHADTPNDALSCPGCNAPTPRGRADRGERHEARKERHRAASRAEHRTPLLRRLGLNDNSRYVSPLASSIAVIVAVVACGAGLFYYMGGFTSAKEFDPARLTAAITIARSLPSSTEGQTVDEVLTEKLHTSIRAGLMFRHQGWRASYVAGDRFLVSYVFEEVNNVEYRAEWEVDTTTKATTPLSPLAVATTKSP